MKKKHYCEMTTSELRQATKQYDKEELGLPGRPLTKSDRAQLDKAARRGRPRVGRGAKRVLVTIERGMLEKADATAKQLGISRSELIARGLRGVISKVA